jgi:hypothetical protein
LTSGLFFTAISAKGPTFFNAAQIEALRARYRSDKGKRPRQPTTIFRAALAET